MTEFDFDAALAFAYEKPRGYTPEQLAHMGAKVTVSTMRHEGITNRFRVAPDNGPAELRDLHAYSPLCAAYALAEEYARDGFGGANVRHEGGNTYSFESNEMEGDVAARYEFEITPVPVRGNR